MSESKHSTTMKLLKNFDVVSRAIIQPNHHPELPDDIKKEYDVLEHVLDNGESYYTPTQLLLHVDSKNNCLNEHFAQLLKNKTDTKDYLVVSRNGPITLESKQLVIEKIENFQLVRIAYEKVIDAMNAMLSKDHIFKYELTELISFEPKYLGIVDEEPVPSVPGCEDYTRYEDLHQDTKLLIQILICDFTKTDTFQMMRGDLGKTVMGFPTVQGLGEAFGVLSMLHSYYKGRIMFRQFESPAHLCSLYRVCIPCCVGPDGQLPPINSKKKVHENGEVVRAILSKTYRDELTLVYAAKVDLYLSRLQYQLTRLEQHSAGIWSDIHRCVANTGRSGVQLLNVFTFDTSNTSSGNDGESSNTTLLWHGTNRESVYSILRDGMQISTTTEYNMFGQGIYFCDTVAKAARYCDTTRDDPDVVLLLCEVKLGRSKSMHRAQEDLTEAPAGYNSVKGAGYFEMGVSTTTDQYGARIYVQKPKRKAPIVRRSLQYNEFVVYDRQRVKVRYLVHAKLAFRAPSKREYNGHAIDVTGDCDAQSQ